MKLVANPTYNRKLRSARKQVPFYLMMSPGLLFIAVMCYIPMGGVLIAFKDYNARDGIFGSPWMDPLFKNFEFFFKSEAARTVTFNTLFYNIIEMVTVTVGALLLAILLSEVKNKFLSATYKGSILLPVFLSWIVVQYILFGLLSVDRGMINNMITSTGGEAIYWYSEPDYWRFILPFAYLWKNIGYYSVLYVAAIAGINTDYYEAAQLDGASKWQQVKYVTLPLLKPIIIVLSLLWVGKLFNGGLGDWNGFYTLANDSGALYASTDVIDTLVFRSLKKLNDYGMSSAIGLYQAVVGFVLVLVSNYIIKKTDPDSALF
ncbi:ABC transporter permease subunit [Paenibacillus sp. LHD-117]|uniref:ABC transporter permease n=1 Tax=Paenibacillus sp. LHD-117 TaxID=3071412 RepID=UPI0027E03446|nr:ABC transporter permease subunit [Paenibacillus sp. LHD-117]MDQ6421429.1 ABC transporter permease subunit [Paenibacillus sp. LHD-117]